MDELSRSACCACAARGVDQPNRTEVHHIVDMGNRAASGGHDATIPLCGWHHRGVPSAQTRNTTRDMTRQYGPSLALSKRAFVREFGTERALLASVNERLGRPREVVLE